MGQKVSPIGFRLGYNRPWDSLWFARKKVFADQLLEDVKIRKYVKENYKQCAISAVVIERASEKIRVNIHTARPGVIIGRKGADIDRLKDSLTTLIGRDLQINIREVKNPALSAQLVAENVALQLERRIAFRRAMKKSMQQTMDAGAKGIQIKVKGRLGGSEIARTEWYRNGSVPLHTIRADVDYGFIEALTAYGKIGVKVWLYRGDIIERPNLFELYGNTQNSRETMASRQPKRADARKKAADDSAPRHRDTKEALTPGLAKDVADGEDKRETGGEGHAASS